MKVNSSPDINIYLHFSYIQAYKKCKGDRHSEAMGWSWQGSSYK